MACKSSASLHVMNGGDGPHSYAHNSSLQSNGVENAKVLINQVIDEKLELKQLISSSPSSRTFALADLGCSVGPNTFIAVQNIIESVKLKWQTCIRNPEEGALEFQVFFNDHVLNDFNHLFQSLPPNKQYYAAGVPGSFRGRLFPKASLHFVHSSYALHWLSSVPREVVDQSSPAYNKGRIYYTSAPNDVVEAYSAQFAKDMESFLNARAQELVCGGLMVLLIPCRPEEVPPLECSTLAYMHLLGDSLMDMAQMGLVDEAKVDSFNLPMYFPTARELETLMTKNTGGFTMDRIEPHIYPAKRPSGWNNIPTMISHLRSSLEGLFKDHFGDDIIEDLFDMLSKKVADSSILSQSSSHNPTVKSYFILLKRNIA